MTSWRWTLSAAALTCLLQQASPASLAAPAALQEQGAATTPEQRLAKIRADFKAAYEAFNKAFRAAKTEEERRALFASKLPDGLEFAQRYRQVALDAKATPVAAEAWMESLRTLTRGDVKDIAAHKQLLQEASKTLLADHIDSEQLMELPELLVDPFEPADAESCLRTLRAKAGAEGVRAGATFKLATSLIENKPLATPEREAEARRLLEEVRTRYSSVLDAYRRPFGPLVEGWLFQLDHLQPGMQVPEIEAPDLQGVTFKLSDYRGKVVLLDFWGHW